MRHKLPIVGAGRTTLTYERHVVQGRNRSPLNRERHHCSASARRRTPRQTSEACVGPLFGLMQVRRRIEPPPEVRRRAATWQRNPMRVRPARSDDRSRRRVVAPVIHNQIVVTPHCAPRRPSLFKPQCAASPNVGQRPYRASTTLARISHQAACRTIECHSVSIGYCHCSEVLPGFREQNALAAPSHGGAGPRAEPKAPPVGHFCPRAWTCSLHHKRWLCFRSRAHARGQNPARSSGPW